MKRNVRACFYITHCLNRGYNASEQRSAIYLYSKHVRMCFEFGGRERDGMRRLCFNLTQLEGIALRHIELLHLRVVFPHNRARKEAAGCTFLFSKQNRGTTIWLHDILSICLAYISSNNRQKQRLKPLCSESCLSVPLRESYKGLYCLHRWKTVA